MARKRKKKGLAKTFSKLSNSLEEETKHSVFAVLFFVFGIFLSLSAFSFAGTAGDFVYKILSKIVGAGYLLLPVSFFMLSYSFFRTEREHILLSNLVGLGIFLISGLGLLELMGKENIGGVVGKIVSTPLIRFFDLYISTVVLAGLLVISILIIFNARIPKIALPSFGRKKETTYTLPSDDYEYDDGEDEDEEESENEEGEYEEKDESYEEEEEEETAIKTRSFTRGKFVSPPLSLLEKDSGKPGVGDIKANANIIKRTLANFGISVEIDEVSVGPSITRYALKPAEGVRISRIVGLQNDLALALAAHPLRVEAPIPGKSLVGIEIPNSRKTTVGLASILSSKDFQDSDSPLTIALGRGVTGIPKFANLSKLPHVLIAGATGAGKSVSLHSIIVSLLFKNAPENLRFIMIDPKRVELTLYKDTPHLLTPVITDPKKAILSLKWAIKEMDRRYNILEQESVRDIQSYHKNILEPAIQKKKKNLPEEMPYIVIVIDEIADIMGRYPRELEAAIVRLAQMSRAVGIHIILSTQRPSVDIITGLIKANIPARVALQVSSQVDSRTILDMSGAEKLLGAGDLLYVSGEMSKPIRLQSAFISEPEVKKVVRFLYKNYEDSLSDDINFDDVGKEGALISSSIEEGGDDEDPMYEEAKEIVISTKKASTSFLQRKLRIGYARAARLIDILEERGVVGPADGAKAREVYSEEESEDKYE